MDIVSHILIGLNAGKIGVQAQVMPDMPLILLTLYQLFTGKESIRDAIYETHPKETDAIVDYLLMYSKILHSWLMIPLQAILFYLMGARGYIEYTYVLFYALHLAIDWATHRQQYPLYPISNLTVRGIVDWSHLPLYKFLVWIPLFFLYYFLPK